MADTDEILAQVIAEYRAKDFISKGGVPDEGGWKLEDFKIRVLGDHYREVVIRQVRR